MILKNRGEKLLIGENMFFIGEVVLANDASIYKDHIGKIVQIRTDEDKDTNNIGPDIYVDFGEGEVIMAADMLVELPF